MEELKEELKNDLYRCVRAILIAISKYNYQQPTVVTFIDGQQRKINAACKKDPEMKKYLYFLMFDIYREARLEGINGPPLPSDERYPPEYPYLSFYTALTPGGYDYHQWMRELPRHTYRYTGPL